MNLFTQVRHAGKVTLNVTGTGRGTLAVRSFCIVVLLIYGVSVHGILNGILLFTGCADIQNYEEG